MLKPNNKMLIALAEDDEDDRSFFAETFKSLKVRSKILLFKNGKELMDYLNCPETELPTIIFLDLNMPIMGGIEALNWIRSQSRLDNIFIAIFSTSSSERDIEETFVLGANVYL